MNEIKNTRTINDLTSKCTILVNSCDIYSDVWELFFASVRQNWKNCPFEFVLNTESKQFEMEDINLRVSNCDGDNTWGRRFRNALKSIDTPYVLPILEDFVLTDKVDESIIYKIMEWMDKEKDISVFYIYNHPYVIKEKTKYDKFGLLPQNCPYRLTTAIGVWRTEMLYSYIKDMESPWEWEMYGSIRARRFKTKMFALLSKDDEVFKFPYGGVIRRGLWHTETPEIADKYGTNIDFTKRGFMDPNNPYRDNDLYSVRHHFPKDVFKAVFWKTTLERIKLYARVLRIIL